MSKRMTYLGLLFTTALVAPATAFAQAPQPTPTPAPEVSTPPVTPPAEESQATDQPDAGEAPVDPAAPPEEGAGAEVSAPGADIVVRGTRTRNIVRQAPEVVSVLSAEDIARTGEGDIAGALRRVTGLSVVGNGFVYVRGLGDRYSLSLLNGSPLPSPEPLRRVVPLDIFPTGVIASSLVQKSYSANYPGEFGGGVINLTTPAVPREAFLDVGASVSGDTETTFHHGYSYFGSDLDWSGFDDGTRDFPAPLANVLFAGTFNATSGPQRQDFAASLSNAPTTLLQRLGNTPANFSGEITAGASREIRGGRIGFIAAIGYSNTWRTRDAIQQFSGDANLAGIPQFDFETVTTDNRLIFNTLIGFGAEFGEHRIRWTNLYIRDSLKQGRLSVGDNSGGNNQVAGAPRPNLEQNTFWFERQLVDTQLTGEFRFDALSIDLRGTFANSQRESPYERSIGYFFLGDGDTTTKSPNDVDDYVNRLSGTGQFANIGFSNLNEDVWAGAADVAYRFEPGFPITFSAGYAYTQTDRRSSRFQLEYFPGNGALPIEIAQQRPDFLLSDFNIYTFNIQLRDVTGPGGAAIYEANLDINAGYAQVELEPTDSLRFTAGVRYENAEQVVQPLLASPPDDTPTTLNNSYWLPAATLTWSAMEDLQIRLHASKTIARPQFRELARQVYQDFESDREFTGNPFLTDSELLNFEGRIEWYYTRGQRITLSGFYKKIDNPIEATAFLASGQNQLRVGFANAPQATLYGGELEIVAYHPLENLGGPFFATRRLMMSANYTYTNSEITADDTIVIGPDLQPVASNLLFQDGAPMTGQSDHLINVQLGIEDTESLSQATFLFTFASDRVTNRGPIVGTRQPDIIERPGMRLDFVLRQEIPIFGVRAEFKLEARNITGTDYEEFQQINGNRIDINSYNLGTSFSAGVTFHF